MIIEKYKIYRYFVSKTLEKNPEIRRDFNASYSSFCRMHNLKITQSRLFLAALILSSSDNEWVNWICIRLHWGGLRTFRCRPCHENLSLSLHWFTNDAFFMTKNLSKQNSILPPFYWVGKNFGAGDLCPSWCLTWIRDKTLWNITSQHCTVTCTDSLCRYILISLSCLQITTSLRDTNFFYRKEIALISYLNPMTSLIQVYLVRFNR